MKGEKTRLTVDYNNWFIIFTVKLQKLVKCQKIQFLLTIIIIIIPRQCLWCCHHGRAIARVHPVQLMNAEWRQAAADPRPSQTT